MTGILTGDQVGFAEGLDGAQGDVAKVADGSRDEGDLGLGRLVFRCHRQGGR
jgi:hypothetical protein